jgi:hypothetical protein
MPTTKQLDSRINKPIKVNKGGVKAVPKRKKKNVKRKFTFWDCVFMIFYLLLILSLVLGVYAYFSLLGRVK